MKFDVLRSIGHNVAYSLSSGSSLLIGSYGIDMYGEARRIRGGRLTVDFLSGVCVEGGISASLADLLAKCPAALNDLCVRHRVSAGAFEVLTAQYSGRWFEERFVVTVEDRLGRRAVDQYKGATGSRPRVFDALHRVRRAPTVRSIRPKN